MAQLPTAIHNSPHNHLSRNPHHSLKPGIHNHHPIPIPSPHAKSPITLPENHHIPNKFDNWSLSHPFLITTTIEITFRVCRHNPPPIPSTPSDSHNKPQQCPTITNSPIFRLPEKRNPIIRLVPAPRGQCTRSSANAHRSTRRHRSARRPRKKTAAHRTNASKPWPPAT